MLSPVSSRFARSHERAHDAGLLLGAAVAEDGLHLHALGHVHHAPGLGHDALPGIELDLDELDVLTHDLEVDLVGAAAGHGRGRAMARGSLPGGCGTAPPP